MSDIAHLAREDVADGHVRVVGLAVPQRGIDVAVGFRDQVQVLGVDVLVLEGFVIGFDNGQIEVYPRPLHHGWLKHPGEHVGDLLSQAEDHLPMLGDYANRSRVINTKFIAMSKNRFYKNYLWFLVKTYSVSKSPIRTICQP